MGRGNFGLFRRSTSGQSVVNAIPPLVFTSVLLLQPACTLRAYKLLLALVTQFDRRKLLTCVQQLTYVLLVGSFAPIKKNDILWTPEPVILLFPNININLPVLTFWSLQTVKNRKQSLHPKTLSVICESINHWNPMVPDNPPVPTG
jgi:hypothetical protein